MAKKKAKKKVGKKKVGKKKVGKKKKTSKKKTIQVLQIDRDSAQVALRLAGAASGSSESMLASTRLARQALEARLRPAVQRASQSRFAASSIIHSGGEGNILGFGIGEKISNGRYTGQRSIKVYVREKVPARALSDEFRIPQWEGHVVTDVEEIAPFVSLAGFKDRYNPVPAGSSIGAGDASIPDSGTLGSLVVADDKLCILSNNHVLALVNQLPSGADTGAAIVQPGTLYGGESPADLVARLLDYEPILFGMNDENTMDAAIAITAWDLCVGRHHCFEMPVNTVDPFEPFEDLTVVKCGGESGYTKGRIVDNEVSMMVDYEGHGAAYFVDQIMIKGESNDFGPARFSERGDSGCVVTTNFTNSPVGLLFAGRGNRALATPLGPIIERFNISRFNPTQNG